MNKEKGNISKRSGLDDLLSRIDEQLPSRPKFELKEITGFTDWMYNNAGHYEGGKTDANGVSALKDKASSLVIKKSGEYFPGSQDLRKEFKSLVKRYEVSKTIRRTDDALSADLRLFRNKALHHVLSSDPDTLPDAFQNTVKDIQKGYTDIEEKYKTKYNNSLNQYRQRRDIEL